MSIHVLTPQPTTVKPDAPLVELETQLRAAVASADASNKTAASLIQLMVEKRSQSVRSIARLVGKSPAWVHAMLMWAREDYRDDPFSRSKRVQPAEQPETEAETAEESTSRAGHLDNNKATSAAEAWQQSFLTFAEVAISPVFSWDKQYGRDWRKFEVRANFLALARQAAATWAQVVKDLEHRTATVRH
jgi:hypothetical protein